MSWPLSVKHTAKITFAQYKCRTFQSIIYPADKNNFIGISSILAWGKSRVGLPPPFIAILVLFSENCCNKKLTLGQTSAEGWMPPPKVFLSFFLEDKTSAPDVFSSYSFIPCAHFNLSSVIISFYGYEIWGHKEQVVKPFSRESTCFFQLFSTIKVNLEAKIMQSAFLWIIFHVKHKKSPFFSWF